MFEIPRDLLIDTDLVVTWPRLFAQGMEVTQGIQYYRSDQHLTDPADQGADNAVTLVALKPAWVRVYVRSWKFWGDIPDVTGTLTVSRRDFGLFYSPVTTLSPEPPGTTVTAHPNPDYLVERGTPSETLNFVIPAEYMCGHLRLELKIEEPTGCNAKLTR